MSALPRSRLLAVDPTRQGFAYVLLESQILIDWGLVHAGGTVEASIGRLGKLVSRYRPTLLLIEPHNTASRRSPRAQEFLVSVELLGILRKVAIERVSRAAVKKKFPESRTKHDIALELADQYPELRMWRPRKRKPWMSEDERMNIFDALAIAETFLSHDGPLPTKDQHHEENK